MRQYDDDNETVRQYDGDSAIVRWRQCDNTMTTVRQHDSLNDVKLRSDRKLILFVAPI
ncbi:hypothetical protein DPMN_170890, partial [Dreissena polymorpha]